MRVLLVRFSCRSLFCLGAVPYGRCFEAGPLKLEKEKEKQKKAAMAICD
jgi:hypothetical protein